MSLGKNIKILRTNNLLSQEKFSECMKVSRQVISKWENGNSEPVSFSLGSDYINSANRIKQQMVKHSVIDNDDILLPVVKPESLIAYQAFRQAYSINVEIDETGDTSNILEMMNLYEEALDDGLVEAGVNILNIVVRTLINAKAFSAEKPLQLQDRLECYMKALEEAGHPAGGFYRAFVLIYGLMITEKTEEENLEDGLILMYKLANEGNELAMKYLDYIENAKQED
ncbi:helix-turn-helix transcriptional regulator [Clostridium beijerinckii]|uniref:HTH cro/C1-type domain-containing protein n=1 Tax=Clostridium beijerinckii TaxID=1520 RepID=A0A1S8S6Z0_CLOBE|nr:helix-turn-helix transcriptional regulator [Clostridium beijerinckii]NRY61481.1 transcriptional regulator with XRE-family HTH domain [Clostridium beijerinckii]OOM61268.1 hypothetical protein CLBCK_24020 [Clostridium beijerinckii]